MTEPREPIAPGTRGRPFGKGNPGRPRGVKDKRVIMAEAMSSDDFKKVVAAMLRKALKGDVPAGKLFFDRLWPVPKGRNVFLPFPDTGTAEGVAAAMSQVVQALGRGELDPAEAQQVEQVLEGQRRALETAELAQRVKRLEGRR